MARAKWKTYGYDSARANAHIGRATGKWGRLKTPDEVWDYMERYMNDQASMLNPPADDPKAPQQRKHGMPAARAIIIGNGKASLYTADLDGKPKDLLEEKDNAGNGKAWKCADCGTNFTAWADFVQHSLDMKAQDAVQ
jgi:hypothetical protein